MGVELQDGRLGCRQRPYVMQRRRPLRHVGVHRTVLQYFFLLTTKKRVTKLSFLHVPLSINIRVMQLMH
jgi:hypothetical protein